MPDSKTFMASLFDWPEVLITRARIFLLSIKLLVKVPAWFIETTSEKYKAELSNRFSRAGFKSARTVVIARSPSLGRTTKQSLGWVKEKAIRLLRFARNDTGFRLGD